MVLCNLKKIRVMDCGDQLPRFTNTFHKFHKNVTKTKKYFTNTFHEDMNMFLNLITFRCTDYTWYLVISHSFVRIKSIYISKTQRALSLTSEMLPGDVQLMQGLKGYLIWCLNINTYRDQQQESSGAGLCARDCGSTSNLRPLPISQVLGLH